MKFDFQVMASEEDNHFLFGIYTEGLEVLKNRVLILMAEMALTPTSLRTVKRCETRSSKHLLVACYKAIVSFTTDTFLSYPTFLVTPSKKAVRNFYRSVCRT